MENDFKITLSDYLLNNFDKHKELELGLEEGFISNIGNNIVSFFSNTRKDIKKKQNFIAEFLNSRGTLHVLKEIKKAKKRSIKYTEKTPFNKIGEKETMCVVGLTTTIQNFEELIAKEFTWIEENSLKAFDKIDDILAGFIGSDDIRKSFRKSNLFQPLKIHNEDIKKSLKAIIDVNDNRDLKKVQTIVGNSKSYVSALDLSYENNNIIDDKFIAKYEKLQNKMNERLNIIIKIVEKNEIVVSKETLIGLAEAIETFAEHLTMISTVYYLHIKACESLLAVDKIYGNTK